MSVTARLRRLLGLNDDTENGTEALRKLLAEREATLNLTATYGEPYPNMDDEPTVVFPYVLTTEGGGVYGSGQKEFPLPDDGLDDDGSPLTTFISKRHGISAEDITFENLAAVEGTSASADFNDEGDIVVGAV